MTSERNLMAATLRLDVIDRTLARALLEEWAARPGVSVNLVRGRVTPDSAKYELEVRGSAAEVTEILRQGRRWNVPRRAGRPAPIPALA